MVFGERLEYSEETLLKQLHLPMFLQTNKNNLIKWNIEVRLMANVDFEVFTKISWLKCGVKKSRCIFHAQENFSWNAKYKIVLGDKLWKKIVENADFRLFCAKMAKFWAYLTNIFLFSVECMFQVKTNIILFWGIPG